MRSLVLVTLVVTLVSGAAVPKSVHLEPHHVDKKTAVDNDIKEALKDLEESRNIIRMTVTMNDTDDDSTFFNDIEDTFNGMLASLHNTRIPFFSQDAETEQKEERALEEKKAKNEKDLMTRTREELKNDVAVLQSYVGALHDEFNEWVISNRHQEVKSMIIGALSAVAVLVAYFAVSKWCRRRSRLTHLSAFANEGFHGDTEGLLPTKNVNKMPRHPSNSDEDI